MRLTVPKAVQDITRRLEDAGHETWAVGGAVRDALAPEPSARPDWDLATEAVPDEVRKLFRRTYPIGIEFGTVGVRGIDDTVYEVTTFRRDVATDGRHAVVEYSDSLDEDLARRDFTINAIAYHPLRDEVRDPFGGLADLQNRTLRCVGDPDSRFAEDYLRILRGLRFAGLYGLNIDPDTWRAMRSAVDRLSRLSAERIREELLKVLSSSEPTLALDLYRRSGALAVVISELGALRDTQWTVTSRTIAALSRPQQRLGALLAPAAGAAREILERLRFSNVEVREVTALTAGLEAEHPRPGDAVEARRWLAVVGRETAPYILEMKRADALARGDSPAEIERLASVVESLLERGDPVRIGDLAIDGDDLKGLGLTPGPEFRDILAECLEAVILDPALNEKERLLQLVRNRGSD